MTYIALIVASSSIDPEFNEEKRKKIKKKKKKKN